MNPGSGTYQASGLGHAFHLLSLSLWSESEDGVYLKVKTGWDDGMESRQLPRDRSLTSTVIIPTSRGNSKLSTQVGQKAGASFTEGSKGKWYQEKRPVKALARGRDSATLPNFAFRNTQFSEPNNKRPICIITESQGPISYYKEQQLFNCPMTLSSQ